MDSKSSNNGLVTENRKLAVLMVPFPAQGHLNQLLHLSNRLVSQGLPVHYAGSSLHNRQAKQRLISCWNDAEEVHFHDLQLPPFNSPAPKADPSMQFPAHIQPLIDVVPQLRQQVFDILSQLSSNFDKVIVIHDFLVASVVQDAKSLSNVESYNFFPVSAFTVFISYWKKMATKPFELDSHVLPSNCIIPSTDGCYTPEFSEFMGYQEKFLGSESGTLFNTSRLIEGQYVQLLEKLANNIDQKIFAIGPFHQLPETGEKKHSCLDWLDKQSTASSVIYVSFGSTTTMTNEQIDELATGLEKSEQKFIWVLRSADKGNVFEGQENFYVLPEGFEERVKDRGIVVRDWAPQVEVLSHPSVGGFMSHCGWNSCLESISTGVPIAAWPIHSDQPRNAILVTEVLRIGTLVRDWARRSEIVPSLAIVKAIRRLMVSEEGHEMRKNAEKLRDSVCGSIAAGASNSEMDSFIAHITT